MGQAAARERKRGWRVWQGLSFPIARGAGGRAGPSCEGNGERHAMSIGTVGSTSFWKRLVVPKISRTWVWPPYCFTCGLHRNCRHRDLVELFRAETSGASSVDHL